VKASNAFFDANHQIQVADFNPIRLGNGSVEPCSGELWSPTVDISGFVFLLSEIMIDHLPNAVSCSAVPRFVSKIIADGRSPRSQNRFSFVDLVARLKTANFDVDSKEVFVFVSWVESPEQSGGWK
jgi:hypothetical protein